jgi:hypothetical protein
VRRREVVTAVKRKISTFSVTMTGVAIVVAGIPSFVMAGRSSGSRRVVLQAASASVGGSLLHLDSFVRSGLWRVGGNEQPRPEA